MHSKADSEVSLVYHTEPDAEENNNEKNINNEPVLLRRNGIVLQAWT